MEEVFENIAFQDYLLLQSYPLPDFIFLNVFCKKLKIIYLKYVFKINPRIFIYIYLYILNT